ncbi:hypothetical protein [Streptacidiphilus albus]|uniref:hypothetical protein n=1 Tax=Streptacidiphilus albus TaxID=105425 RepID=UPI00128C9E95|nr:hypothetical protein [Streptacidiphilus albus]
MTMHAEGPPIPQVESDLLGLVMECERCIEFHEGRMKRFKERRDQAMSALEALRGAAGLVASIRRELRGDTEPLLRVVPEPGPAKEPKVIKFKRGSISASILALLEADPVRTAPWSVDEITEALAKEGPTTRGRVSANLDHVFRRGALEKVPVPEDPEHVYYRVCAPWALVD